MTLILGTYYNNNNGILIASESRAVRKYDIMPFSRKITQINEIILSLSGVVSLIEEITEGIEEQIGKKSETSTIREIIHQVYSEKREFYTSGDNPTIEKKKFQCSGLIGFFNDKPELFHVSDSGVLSSLQDDKLMAVGQKQEYAEGIIRDLYWDGINQEQAIKLAVYTLNEVSKKNGGVDNRVQIATIEEGKIKILNLEEEKEFDFEKFNPVIEKMESERTASLQRVAFHTLMFGEEKTRKDLETLLKNVKTPFND